MSTLNFIEYKPNPKPQKELSPQIPSDDELRKPEECCILYGDNPKEAAETVLWFYCIQAENLKWMREKQYKSVYEIGVAVEEFEFRWADAQRRYKYQWGISVLEGLHMEG